MNLFRVQDGNFGTNIPKEVEYIRETCQEMDDTNYPGPVFGDRQDGNIFEMVCTYFRVQMDLLRFQNRHFWTNLPKEVEYIWKTC